ncbi:MAG: hypothetical protein NT062_17020, partial [Proteobacteria bacterium]|nr:hypothetical protein [Pseudomonadota bacterium]
MTTIGIISRRTAVLLAVVALSEGAARADMPPAEKLFREGRDLMNRGKFTEACLHFAQSLAIADEVGPRMNLALCEEKRGHLLAALSGFEI